MKNKIGKNIRVLRKSQNMSQKEFADQIGTTQTSLSLYETSAKIPPSEILLKIADCFGVSLDWLCGIKSTCHFVTGEDVLDIFLEIENSLDWEVDGSDDEKIVISRKDKNNQSEKNVFELSDLVEFEKSYQNLKKSIYTISDEEVRKDYLEMWIEKMKRYYSDYSVPQNCN